MAGFITLDHECPDMTWSSANWVYAGFLNHVIHSIPDDEEVVRELTSCKYHQIVDLAEILGTRPGVYNRIVEAFSRTCNRIRRGDLVASVSGRELDEESQIQFRQAACELEEFLDRLGTSPR
jgi:hypothetical protein